VTPEEIDARWDYNDPAASEKRLRQALANTKGGVYNEIQTQIARAQGLQGAFDDAHATLAQIEEHINDVSGRVRARYYLERGRVLRSSGDPEAARPLFVQAWKTARGAGEDFYAIDAAHMLALVEPSEKQLRWYHRGMNLAEESDDPRARKWLGALCNNAGWYYCDSNHYKDALPLFEKALAAYEEQGAEQSIRIAEWTVGHCLRKLGRVEEALAIQQRLQRECDKVGEPDAYVLEELAECFTELGLADEARPFFSTSLFAIVRGFGLAGA
jgi:tetratricopeptide (TPR) repeat protein